MTALRPIDIARAAGPCGSKEYHNAYQKARYKLKRKDQVYLEKERAYNRARYATPGIRDGMLARNKRYRERPSSKLKEKERDLRRKYRLTVSQYEEMGFSQKWRCAICDTHIESLARSLEVDHSHSTGKIRGLLCRKCNLVLGIVDDRSSILHAAIRYLEAHS